MSTRKAVIAISATVGLASVCYLWRRGEGPPAPSESRFPQKPASSTFAKPAASVHPASISLPEEHAQLVEEWKPLNSGPNRYIYVDEDYALARKCVLKLGCSDDLISLINTVALQDDGIGRVFDKVVRELLASESGQRHHTAIASITTDTKMRERWSYLAGVGCTSSALDKFSVLLTAEKDRIAARLGHQVNLAQTDPVLALTTAAQLASIGKRGENGGEVFQDIVNAATDSRAFPVMEAQLRSIPEAAHGNSLSQSREKLLEKWADADPPTLAAYFNDHPNEMTPQDASNALVRVSWSDPSKAFEFAQNFEHAEHFDAAVVAVLPYVRTGFPKESYNLAEQISNVKIREAAITAITKGNSDGPP